MGDVASFERDNNLCIRHDRQQLLQSIGIDIDDYETMPCQDIQDFSFIMNQTAGARAPTLQIYERLSAARTQIYSRSLSHELNLLAPQGVLRRAPEKILVNPCSVGWCPVLSQTHLIDFLMAGISWATKAKWMPVLFGQAILRAVIDKPMTEEPAAQMGRRQPGRLQTAWLWVYRRRPVE